MTTLDLLEFITEVRGRGKGKELRWRYHGTAFSRDGNSRRYRRLAFRGRFDPFDDGSGVEVEAKGLS